MLYYVLDLEYNQFFDFSDNKPRPEPACPAEIIQMGLVVLDDKLNVKEKRETLVKPQIFRRLHPHVARVTGLSISDLQRAPSFPDAFLEFFDFAFGKRAVFCTWGADDLKELFRNILYYDLNHKRLTRRYLNVQHLYWLHSQKGKSDGENGGQRQTALKTAVDTLSIPSERPFHNALSDAEYTSDVFTRLLLDKAVNLSPQPQILNLKDLQDIITGRVSGVNIRLLYAHAEHSLRRKLTERDKAAILEIYTLGRTGKFDSRRRKK